MRAITAAASRHPFALILALTLAFRLWLSSVFPITGDEAYFITWGAHPDLGFYDHPPMVGWLLALLLTVSSAEWVLRLPATRAQAGVALALYLALRRGDRERASLAAVCVLLLPISVWNVFITTDTPLLVWSVLSVLAYREADARGSAPLYALAGVLLGLALLSKYFAVLLALAYLIHALVWWRGQRPPNRQRPLRGLAITFVCAAPWVALHLWWNSGNCWANLMFNLFNRHGDAGLSWKTPLLFLLTAAYLLWPPALAQLVLRRGALAARWRAEPGLRLLGLACAVPFTAFALLSAFKLIGLHWALSFVPFFYAFAALALDLPRLRAMAKFLGLFSLLHVTAILVAANLPLEAWAKSRFYDGIVFHFRIGEVVGALERHRGEFALAADGYSPAATLSYYLGRTIASARTAAGAQREGYVFVFGSASSHARHDDLLTDYRRLAGRDIVVFRKNAPLPGEYAPYFRSVETRTLALAGATFHLVFGRGFDYAAYRERVLAPLRERYYAIPDWLPQRNCWFCERYFGAPVCPPRGPA